MICRKCGELLGDNARVCPACGARQEAGAKTTVNPTHSYSEDCAHDGHTSGTAFFDSPTGKLLLKILLLITSPLVLAVITFTLLIRVSHISVLPYVIGLCFVFSLVRRVLIKKLKR